jgi:hypothetical protein
LPGCKPELPLAIHTGELMTAPALRQLLVDGGDGARRGLQAAMQGLGQSAEAVAQLQHERHRRRASIEIDVLRGRPAEEGGLVLEKIRRSKVSPARRIDEIEPERVAQQGEF